MTLSVRFVYIAVAFWLATSALPAHACSYFEGWPWQEAKLRTEWAETIAGTDHFEFVFVGKVKTVQPLPSRPTDGDVVSELVEFEVRGTLEGSLPGSVTVVNNTLNDCGGWKAPSVGSEAFVLARRLTEGTGLEATMIAVNADMRALLRAFAKSGRKPKAP